MACKRQKDGDERPWFLKSSYAVSLPHHDALTMSQPDFERFLVKSLHGQTDINKSTQQDAVGVEASASIRPSASSIDIDNLDRGFTAITPSDPITPFVKDSLDPEKSKWMPSERKGATSSSVMAWKALSEIVSLWDDSITPNIGELCGRAWAYDPHVTLRAVFTIRSIHLGNSSKYSFYAAAGWLARNHPLTLIANLQWLVRPVIEEEWVKRPRLLKSRKRRLKTHEEEDGFDVDNGLSHGYWKDLLNILVLAAMGKLDGMSDAMEALNKQNNRIKAQAITKRHKKRNTAAFDKSKIYKHWRLHREGSRGGRSRMLRPLQTDEDTGLIEDSETAPQQEQSGNGIGPAAIFESSALYRALHLAVARMFAQQLKADLEALRGSDARAKDKISLCGKWAPSHKRFHDRHTLIATSVAEILHPRESLAGVFPSADGYDEAGDREIYLRYAREEYRKDVSALRKHLDVVERKLTMTNYASIEYDQLDTHVLKKYKPLFLERDADHFVEFLDGQAAPQMHSLKAKALLPTMMMDARKRGIPYEYPMSTLALKLCISHRVDVLEARAMEARWQAFVERVRRSDGAGGLFKSSVAVFDCLRERHYAHENAEDDTRPEDTQLGLTLLMAELTPAPFGGSYITFGPAHEVVKIEPEKKMYACMKVPEGWLESLDAKVWFLRYATTDMRYNANFVRLFEKVILPTAVAHGVKREDMIQRVWVFCDKDFASAESSTYDLVPAGKRWGIKTRWSQAHERVKKAYEDAGYRMPELVFWNMLGDARKNDEPRAAKEPGVRMVFGYSQDLIKRLITRGTFDPPGEDEEEDEEEEEEEEEVKKPEVKKVETKMKWSRVGMGWVMDRIMRQGVDMLQVFD